MTAEEFDAGFAAVAALVRAKLDAASGCHDYDHTLRVLANAERLAGMLPEADLRIVRLAALLHDVARPEEMASKGKICHAELGAELVPGILRDAGGFDAEFVDRVAAAVLTHRYRARRLPATLEGEIVYDADKLDSLGAVGIGRAFLFAGREHARLHNTEAEAVNSPAYSREDTAYREYLVKLRKLPAGMLTAPGKAIAQERAAFMDAFFRRLNEETGLNCSGFSIEKAERGDLAEILNLQKKAFGQVAELLNCPGLPALLQTEREIGEEFEKGVVLKCSGENGRIVGSVRAFVDEENACRIGKLIVDPDSQGRGIGRALMAEIERRFPACSRYSLFTSEETPWTSQLYRKLGYRETGRRPMGGTLMILMDKENPL